MTGPSGHIARGIRTRRNLHKLAAGVEDAIHVDCAHFWGCFSGRVKRGEGSEKRREKERRNRAEKKDFLQTQQLPYHSAGIGRSPSSGPAFEMN